MGALDVLILAVLLLGFVKGAVGGLFRQVVSLVGFFAGLLVAFMLYSALAFVLTKAAETVHLGGLNRLGGALLGGLKYLLFLSCALNVASRLQWVPEPMAEQSRLYGPVHALAGIAFDVCKPHVVRAVGRMTSSGAGED